MPCSIGLPIFVISILGLQALGQNSIQTFEWKFGGNDSMLGWALPSCQEIPITISPNRNNATAGNFSGIPPYYMIAFPQHGQPITSIVGNDTDMLLWAPTYPVGTKFILQLMDSMRSTGGANDMYQVIKNPTGNSDCAAPPPPAYFFISSNMTGDDERVLETCDFWRLNINGGEPPYTVVLESSGSPVLTNISVLEGCDAVVYANHADPDIILFGMYYYHSL